MPDSYSESEEYQIRQEKLEKLEQRGIDPYPHNFNKIQTVAEAVDLFVDDPDEELGETVKVAGRIRRRRLHGKAAFADLVDHSGQIQLYLSARYLDDSEQFDLFNELLDIGDFIGVQGELFKTNEGEISVVVRNFKILSKGLRPLPEKFHGLKDTELRYRKRYLDLLDNPEVRELFLQRSQFVSGLRNWLENRNFIEVETPMMQTLAGGAEAEPFITHHNTLDLDLYLRIAPELFLKRLLVGGFEKVYEINRNFRNEGISTRHNPEFTMLELYWAYADYKEIMVLTEQLLSSVIEQFNPELITEYQENSIDWNTPWERLTIEQAIERHTGIELNSEMSVEEIRKLAETNGYQLEPADSSEAQIFELFETAVEKQLIDPTFIIDFPASLSPLAKRHRNAPERAERFELFAGGLEVGNAYSELNDPREQKENFLRQTEDSSKIDSDYIEALEYGMPPAGGLGLGIDRLVMLLTNSASIRDVILFPLLQPLSRED